jgi:hypothetical protein
MPIVVIAAVAWFALSNHCALAAIDTSAKVPMSCHGSSTPNHVPSKQDNHDGVECCKVLRATLLTSAKSVVALDEFFFAPHKYFVGIVVVPDAAEQSGIFEWDTGPPGARSFSEVVLQRSLLAHAPPSLA